MLTLRHPHLIIHHLLIFFDLERGAAARVIATNSTTDIDNIPSSHSLKV